MKINFILPNIGISGGIRVIFEYANRLSERGHDITLLYPLVPPRMEKGWFNPRERVTQILETGQRLVLSRDIDWFDLNASVYRIPTLSPKIIEYFEHLIPDADITIATAWETAYTVAALSDSKGRKSYFVQHYEIWDTWNSDEAWDQVTSLVDNPELYPVEMYEIKPKVARVRRQKELVDSSYRLPMSKITISGWLRDLLESKFNQEVVDVIPNSVNHSTFYPDTMSDDGKGKTSILLPSRNTPWKGEREIQRLVEVIGKSYDVEIHMYGPKENQVEYSNLVVQHSNVSDEELRRLYSKADIFVLPSWVEGYGLPPLEAMACQCAVVATNVGVMLDCIEDGETASIVPPRDSSALIEAVSELIDNPRKQEYLQKRGNELVKSYSWKCATARFERSLIDIAK